MGGRGNKKKGEHKHGEHKHGEHNEGNRPSHTKYPGLSHQVYPGHAQPMGGPASSPTKGSNNLAQNLASNDSKSDRSTESCPYESRGGLQAMGHVDAHNVGNTDNDQYNDERMTDNNDFYKKEFSDLGPNIHRDNEHRNKYRAEVDEQVTENKGRECKRNVESAQLEADTTMAIHQSLMESPEESARVVDHGCTGSPSHHREPDNFTNRATDRPVGIMSAEQKALNDARKWNTNNDDADADDDDFDHLNEGRHYNYKRDPAFKKACHKYEYFWKNHDIYSQWHKSKFLVNGKEFNCAEQYMMYKKAELFEDHKIAKDILKQKNPRKIKALGREVRGFNEDLWAANCLYIVKQGSIAKFSQSDKLKKDMFDTYPKILVEASPFDKIWGIGLGEDDYEAWDETKWRGKNLLGYILTEVRDELMFDAGLIQQTGKREYLEQLIAVQQTEAARSNGSSVDPVQRQHIKTSNAEWEFVPKHDTEKHDIKKDHKSKDDEEVITQSKEPVNTVSMHKETDETIENITDTETASAIVSNKLFGVTPANASDKPLEKQIDDLEVDKKLNKCMSDEDIEPPDNRENQDSVHLEETKL